MLTLEQIVPTRTLVLQYHSALCHRCLLLGVFLLWLNKHHDDDTDDSKQESKAESKDRTILLIANHEPNDTTK